MPPYATLEYDHFTLSRVARKSDSQTFIEKKPALCYAFSHGDTMWNLLVHWAISAISLFVVAYLIPGIHIDGLGPALIAPLVIGLVNATVGFILKILTLPITILSLGVFLLVINALMLMFAAYLVPGFAVAGFWSAFFGAIVMSIVGMILRSLLT